MKFIGHVALAALVVTALQNAAEAASRFRIPPGGVSVDWSCGDVFDVCARVNCRVNNFGNVTGTAIVEFTLLRPGLPTLTATSSQMLYPSQTAWISYGFREVRAGEQVSGSCRVLN